MKWILIITVTLLTISCNDDELGSNTISLDCSGLNLDNLSVTTGVSFYDINGAAIGSYGIANDNSLINSEFSAFPNPASNLITLRTVSTPYSAFWIYAVNCPLNCTELSITTEDYVTNLYEGEEDNFILLNGINSELTTPLNLIQLDLSSIANGSYKAVVRLNTGEYQWQNIIINKETSEIPEIIEYIEQGCE